MSPAERYNDRSGLTIIELAIAMGIMTIILMALVMTLRVGDFASGIGTAKVDIQSDVKMILDWVTRDIRQAKIQDLHDNTPATDYMRFNLWEWNNTSCAQEESDQEVEYDYDALTNTLTRRFIENGTVSYEQSYSGVTMAPFYTSYTDETTHDFNNQTLLNSRSVIVAIKKEATARNKVLNFTMVEKVRIRNE